MLNVDADSPLAAQAVAAPELPGAAGAGFHAEAVLEVLAFADTWALADRSARPAARALLAAWARTDTSATPAVQARTDTSVPPAAGQALPAGVAQTDTSRPSVAGQAVLSAYSVTDTSVV